MAWMLAWIGVVVFGFLNGESEPWYWVGVAITLPVVALLAWRDWSRS